MLLFGQRYTGSRTLFSTEEQRVTLRQVLDGMVRERAGRDGRAVLANAVHIGIGTK